MLQLTSEGRRAAPCQSCPSLVTRLVSIRKHREKFHAPRGFCSDFLTQKKGIFRPGAYSLVPRHFRIAQRRTERWRVQFGAPPFPDCPAPHRKVQGIVRLRAGVQWVPPLVMDRSGIASWSYLCHCLRPISTLRGAGSTARLELEFHPINVAGAEYGRTENRDRHKGP